ncbi:MAG TPA: cobalamin-dependent protein [Acidimicrobiia bacterium]|nr:cobalamin-dependent protein [Acidimicrobiia bacterium]
MPGPEYPEIELALLSSAMSGDVGGLYRIASDLMDNGVPFDDLLFDYLMATERSVGRRWAQGDYLIAEEHAVTAAIETVIALLVGLFDQPKDAPLVVIATAEGDLHSLPARAIAAHLVFLGYRTNFLGASVPGPDMRDFLESEQPAALVLSAAMTTHLVGAREVIAAAHEVGVPVVAGGKAFGPDGAWATAVGADAYVGSLREVADVVERWAEDAGTDLEPVPPVPPGLKALVAGRSAVLAEVESALGEEGARALGEAGLLLSSIEGALLTGDDTVIADMLAWQSEMSRAHGFDASAVADAVAAALEGVSEEAAAAFSRARGG